MKKVVKTKDERIFQTSCSKCLSLIQFTYDEIEHHKQGEISVPKIQCPECKSYTKAVLNDIIY